MRWLILLVPLVVAVVIFATVIRDLVRAARRRGTERDLDQRVRQREQDALELAGGRAEHPIDIETPALVEPMAGAEKCLRCAGDLLVLEHTAERHGDDRLRVADLKCARCGSTRRLFFRLRASQLH